MSAIGCRWSGFWLRLSPLEQVVQVLAARAGTSALVDQLQRVPLNGRIFVDLQISWPTFSHIMHNSFNDHDAPTKRKRETMLALSDTAREYIHRGGRVVAQPMIDG